MQTTTWVSNYNSTLRSLISDHHNKCNDKEMFRNTIKITKMWHSDTKGSKCWKYKLAQGSHKASICESTTMGSEKRGVPTRASYYMIRICVNWLLNINIPSRLFSLKINNEDSLVIFLGKSKGVSHVLLPLPPRASY